MAETAKRSTRTKVEAVPDPAPEPEPSTTADVAGHEPTTCPVAWCPVCLAVTAVQPVRPEVVEHLLKAGTEFFLALRSLIDARGDDLTPSQDDADASLHKIDIG